MTKSRSATYPYSSPGPAGWSTGMLPSSSTTESMSLYPPTNSPPSFPHPRTPYRHAFPPTLNPIYTRDSQASSSNLVSHLSSRQSSPKTKGFSFNWGWFSKKTDHTSGTGLMDPSVHNKGKTRDGRKPTPFHHGWKDALFGSYFNVLLLLVPVSFALQRFSAESDTLIFIFCIFSLIPLVRLHDMATSSLALRIGGTKAALLNATMGNTVEIVIAFIALRKCELRIVQSSLIGSMLSKSLLVFGMCTFAGGLRWKEQWFDSGATQIQSSLLSISTSAVLLPAAFHFALRMDDDDDKINNTPEVDPSAQLDYASQKIDILRMSHGVAIVLIIIYIAYLIFQLYSHSHLYEDSVAGTKSLRFSKKPSEAFEKLVRLPPLKKSNHARSSSLTLRGSSSPDNSDSALSPISPTSPTFMKRDNSLTPAEAQDTVKIVHKDDFVWDNVSYLYRNSSGHDTRSVEDLTREASQEQEKEGQENEEEKVKEPKLSWFMTLLLLCVVTVLVAVTADWLVESMDTISLANKYVSKEWMGLIMLPTIRVIAECVTAINTSFKDQLTLSSGVAIGSTIQTALFVIPFMVIVGWIMDIPLGMLFDPFESVVLYISIHTMNYVVADGKSNWMEGLILICLYFIIAISFWFYPGSNLSSALAACPVK